MKKLIVVLTAMMVVASFGTAMAVDYARNLNDGDYLTPIVTSGGSVYVLASGTATNGATLFQINPVTGASQYWSGAMNLNVNSNGASAYTAPAMIQRNGESGVTFVMQVHQTPDSPGQGIGDVTGGTSLYGLYFSPTNGAGTTQFVTSLAHRRGYSNYATSGASLYYGNDFISATSGWSTHLLIDEVNAPSGATVYGTSGVSVQSASNGASIWAIGLYDGAGRGALNNNQWSAGTPATLGVSSFLTPLAISGDSLFAIGNFMYFGANNGVSLMMFDKRKLQLGPNRAITIQNASARTGSTLFTTPAIAGNSIFVLDCTGGLTAYSIQPTNLLPAARVAGDFVQLGLSANTSVSASPVTDGTFLAVTANHQGAIAGITVFRIDNKRIAGTSGTSWWYEWAAGTTIAATPVISNGSVYVAVNTANNGAAFYRFAMNKGATMGRLTTPDQAWTLDANSVAFGFIEQGGMNIADNRLIAITNSATTGKRLYSLAVGDTASSSSYWRMFKADVSRSGNNTAYPVAAPVGDDDSGCFISTIK